MTMTTLGTTLGTRLAPISVTDAELIAASRGGNREAFGQIVRKYQSMVSGLIYAACGDLHRSEDIAQETFISAWKSLSGLSDSAKLPAWLCQIARRRIADHFRESKTPKVQLQHETGAAVATEFAAESAGELTAGPTAEPSGRAMLAEESEILWRTLSRIAQPYRETLVLYYRQGRSTAEVAAAMETTDAGVRQRLARGRHMLREELAALLERSLIATAPGEEFSLGVVAALPMAGVAGAGLGASVKGSTAAKSGGAFFILSAWLAPLLAALSLGLITLQTIRYADTGRPRKLIAAYWIAFWLVIVLWIVACNKLITFGHHRQWDYATFLPALSAAGCVYGMSLFGVMAWGSARSVMPKRPDRNYTRLHRFWPRFLFLSPLIYCGVGWLVELSMKAGDPLSAKLIAAAAILASGLCAWRASRNDSDQKGISMAYESWALMIGIIVLAADFRLRTWVAAISHSNFMELQQQMPLWSINLFGAVLVLWMSLLAFFSRPSDQIGQS